MNYNQVPNNNMNYNYNYNANMQNNVAPKKKKKHGFLKFLLVVFIIIGIIVGYKFIKKKIAKSKIQKEISSQVYILPNEEIKYTEEEKEIDYTGEGLTFKEKESLKLNPFESDTDHDGLSDVDEIEKYKSDPKKYSTSGDMLSDAYKIANNMDINKKYNDLPIIESPNDSITLIAKRAEDVEAVYEEYDGIIPKEYYPGFKPFRIYSFKGTVNLKIEKPENFEVISYNNLTKESKKIKSKVKDNKLVFDIKDDNPIIISFKSKIVDEMIASNKIEDLYNYSNKRDAEYVVIAMPIFNALFNYPVHIFELTDHNYSVQTDTVLEGELNKAAKGVFTVKVTTMHTYVASILDKIFGMILDEINDPNGGFTNFILIYRHFKSYDELYTFLGVSSDEKLADKDDKKEEKETKEENDFEDKWSNKNCEYCADSGFSVYKNAFNFANLSTKVSPDGVCMGMATLAANAYIPDKYYREQTALQGKEFDEFWNGKVHDYKIVSEELMGYADDINNNAIKNFDSKKIKSPDSLLVGTIEDLYVIGNTKVRSHKFACAFNRSFYEGEEAQTLISSKTIDNLRDYLNKKHVAIVTFIGDNGQHAINVYKMAEDKNDKDIIYLKAYDNNFMDDTILLSGKRTKLDVSITLKRIYKKNPLTKKDVAYYLFDYAPYGELSEGSVFESIHGGDDCLLIFDRYYTPIGDRWVIN